ncbi:MAG: hypothetical protein QMD12_01435 [Candidatus Aenigmarchaeota archaeon]|nr:hypothetical protein [Candidatus Aenigmarchaeota archaeon]
MENQIELCSYYYQKWKNSALSATAIEEARKCFEKAFFWLELLTVYIALWSIERTKGNEPEIRQKIITAKLNLSKKLTEYAKRILSEIQF